MDIYFNFFPAAPMKMTTIDQGLSSGEAIYSCPTKKYCKPLPVNQMSFYKLPVILTPPKKSVLFSAFI